jgi:uncharacterized protein (TIGR00297 family)
MKLNIVGLTDYKSILFRAIMLAAVAHRAHKRRTLTPLGVEVAFMTGFLHSLPPSNLYFILLITFYMSSSKATKYKQEVKAKKTKVPITNNAVAASQSQRTHIQVLCNSAIATLLIILSLFIHDEEEYALLKAGIIGQYCAVIADTWSSELGILSTDSPFLITTFEKVPPGTNGGITKAGLLAGLAGSSLISCVACFTYEKDILLHFVFFTLIGVLGTLIDSLLGALMQSSIVDKEDGLILEPIGGRKVETKTLIDMKGHIKVVSGEDILSNNQVNVMMSFITTLFSIGFYALLF